MRYLSKIKELEDPAGKAVAGIPSYTVEPFAPPLGDVTEAGQQNDAMAALEQSLPGGWVVRWVFAEQGEGAVVRSLTIEPEGQATPTGGVRANTLRELHPADVTSYLDSMITAATLAAEQPDSITSEALKLFVHRGLARMRVPGPRLLAQWDRERENNN